MENIGHRGQYRPDIDGLRALAVLSVVLFHINEKWVPGGYTGVDIFFVISGFLITRIIGNEMAKRQFSLSAFYVRRIKRILPVFYTVTLVTVLVGFALLVPADFSSLAASMRHAIIFLANVYFSKQIGYFDLSAEEKPLLHMWSLSIEEQYYFMWPVLLLTFYAVGRKFFKQPVALSQKTAVVLTLLLVVGGFIYSQYELTHAESGQSLYMMLQTRFCELMIGSCEALLPAIAYERVRVGMSYLGIGLIVLALFYLDKRSVFPGYNALLPCLGAASLIYAGQGPKQQRPLPNRLLSIRVIVGVGLISYSLYLWHWPVLAYMRYVYGQYSLPSTWVMVAIPLMLALSILSYRYVEQTTRRMSLTFPKAFIGLFLIPAVALVGGAFVANRTRSTEMYPPELISYGRDVCHGNFDQQCVRGDARVEPRVLVTGDSHAAALNQFIDVVGKHEGWSAKVLTASSCSPVFGFDENVLPSFAHEPCDALKTYFRENYKRYDAVVLASQWAFHLGIEDSGSDPNYMEKLERTLREISQVAPVYVVSDVPTLAVSPFRTLKFSEVGQISNRASPKAYLDANEKIKELAARIPNVHYVDLSDAWTQFTPPGVYKGKPAYFDDHHLNIYGSSALGRLFVDTGHRIIEPRGLPLASAGERAMR